MGPALDVRQIASVIFFLMNLQAIKCKLWRPDPYVFPADQNARILFGVSWGMLG